MVTRSKGGRQKTRKKLRRRASEKGKIFIKKFLQEFQVGDRVVIKPDPSYQKGMPFRRFIGKAGVVIGKRGRAYEIKIKDGRKEKLIISHPVHLKKVS